MYMYNDRENQYKRIRRIIQALLCVFLLSSISVLYACGVNDKPVVALISYETDIEGLSVQEIKNEKDEFMSIRIILDSYTDCYLSHYHTVLSGSTGEEIARLDGYRINDDTVNFKKDVSTSKWFAEKQYWLAPFDIKESGEYVIHDVCLTGGNDELGKIDLRVMYNKP